MQNDILKIYANRVWASQKLDKERCSRHFSDESFTPVVCPLSAHSFFAGWLQGVNADGSYDVQFDDGERQTAIPPALCRQEAGRPTYCTSSAGTASSTHHGWGSSTASTGSGHGVGHDERCSHASDGSEQTGQAHVREVAARRIP